MSDELTLTNSSASASPEDAGRSASIVHTVLGQSLAVIVGFAVVGALCGVLWERVWQPAHGVVYKHAWYPVSWDRAQPAQFSGAAWYALIGIAAGLILGLVASRWLAESELATLAAVVVGGVLAAVLMRAVGLHLGPADPTVIAKHSANGLRLPSQLQLGWGLIIAFPGGGLVGLTAVFMTTERRDSAPAEWAQELPYRESDTGAVAGEYPER